MKYPKVSYNIRYTVKCIFDSNNIEYSALSKNKYGKLYINDMKTIKFNISHSGGYVVFTIGNNESGVDIEKNIISLDIAKRFFTNYEYQRVVQETSDMFTCIWTLKESYIKEKGLGFYLPLDTFVVHPGKIENEMRNNEINIP